MKVREVKPKAQADWVTFRKGGALLTTKGTFVRVVFEVISCKVEKKCNAA